MYVITKVNKYRQNGALVTHEKTVGNTENLEEILALAKKQGADVAEVAEELEEYGGTSFKGYTIDVW